MTSGKPFSDSLKRPAKKKFLAGLSFRRLCALLSFERLASQDGTSERQSIGIFKVIPEAESSGKSGHFQISQSKSLDVTINIECRGLTLNISAQGKNHFFNRKGIVV